MENFAVISYLCSYDHFSTFAPKVILLFKFSCDNLIWLIFITFAWKFLIRLVLPQRNK